MFLDVLLYSRKKIHENVQVPSLKRILYTQIILFSVTNSTFYIACIIIAASRRSHL